MKTITTSKGEFFVVDLNNNSMDWIFTSIPSFGKTATHYSGFSFKYSHVFKLSEATEEDVSKVVETLWNGYKNYELDGYVGDYNRLVCATAKESIHSLLKSNNITGDNLYIFKKI